MQFLFFAFGDELEFAWDELDDDGSGELSEDEWFSAVKRIGPGSIAAEPSDAGLHLFDRKQKPPLRLRGPRLQRLARLWYPCQFGWFACFCEGPGLRKPVKPP